MCVCLERGVFALLPELVQFVCRYICICIQFCIRKEKERGRERDSGPLFGQDEKRQKQKQKQKHKMKIKPLHSCLALK